MRWTEQAIEQLKRRWEAGASQTVIANELGTSRNAIAGKVMRLNLATRRVVERSQRRPSWTYERIEELKHLCAQGYSYPFICERLGVSVKTVRVQLRKLGLIKAAMPRKRKASGEKKRGGFSLPYQCSWDSGNPGVRIVRNAQKRQEWVEPPDAAPPGCKTLIELEAHDCRYPFSTEDGTKFCAKRALRGVSYCLEHDMLCRPGAYPQSDPVYPVMQREAV